MCRALATTPGAARHSHLWRDPAQALVADTRRTQADRAAGTQSSEVEAAAAAEQARSRERTTRQQHRMLVRCRLGALGTKPALGATLDVRESAEVVDAVAAALVAEVGADIAVVVVAAGHPGSAPRASHCPVYQSRRGSR